MQIGSSTGSALRIPYQWATRLLNTTSTAVFTASMNMPAVFILLLLTLLLIRGTERIGIRKRHHRHFESKYRAAL